MIADLGEEFGIGAECDSTANVVPALIQTEIARHHSTRDAAIDANTPERIAGDGWDHSRSSQQQLSIVKAEAAGCVRTESLLLDEFEDGVRR